MTIPFNYILIRYRDVGGFHTFDSEDLEDFHVTNRDLETAFYDIPEAVEKLLSEKFGMDAICVSVLSYDEFVNSDDEFFTYDID